MQGIYLNDLGLKFVKTCFTNYWGQIYFFGVFVAAVLWFFLAQKHRLIYILFISDNIQPCFSQDIL